MKTIYFNANAVMPNTTGVVGVQVLDIDEPEPTVSLVPILGWALADGVSPQPVCPWNNHNHIDAIYDPSTGHVIDETGGCWETLLEAVTHFHATKKLAKTYETNAI